MASGYGVLVTNNEYPERSVLARDVLGDALAAGITQDAPRGSRKFEWLPDEDRFRVAWTLEDVDNSDRQVPAFSPASGLVYMASRSEGVYEQLGVDWRTGEVKARWRLPDDRVVWNSFTSDTLILDDGDLVLCGLFALKRVGLEPPR